MLVDNLHNTFLTNQNEAMIYSWTMRIRITQFSYDMNLKEENKKYQKKTDYVLHFHTTGKKASSPFVKGRAEKDLGKRGGV
jgi:hypothetical protein